MNHNPYKGLYIHIPFCAKKCNYCNFYSKLCNPDSLEVREYIEDLVMQIRKASKDGDLAEIETIYIGGGTPSYIGIKNLSSLLYAISMSINLDKVKEFTMEVNPDSLNEALVKDIWAMGVNRLSIGVQSFDDDILHLLGRVHSADDAHCAIDIAKKRFENISIDLICGIPGESKASFSESLKKACKLDVPHISVYALSIENNTTFAKWVEQKKMQDIDEDEQADQLELASQVLESAAYKHYEVSNYAKIGYESKHNLSYWQSKPYLGIGKSATTMMQNENKRFRITDDVIDDELDKNQMLIEDLILAMRTSSGIDENLASRARILFSNFDETISQLEDLQFIKHTSNIIVPTNSGWLLGNEIYSRLLNLVD